MRIPDIFDHSMSVSGLLTNFPSRSTTNSTSSAPLQVVCAFPLSSNYGPGSRLLYYVLVAACVTFRKAEWLRNACLAAALVLPAVAALQGLVLVSLHVNGAVDMDIYGAFQFCAIGVLAAPLTVRLSRTYFYDPGRNIIFLWTILILMGLLGLCVEFYRVTPTGCSFDDFGNPLSSSANSFPYGNATCGLVCSVEEGPFSRMRGGAANNVNIIPVPKILTFNAVMLLAAGFCIPAILGLIFTWDKIVEINWKRRSSPERLNEQIEGVNMTVGEMNGINNVVRKFLRVIEIPLFGGVILTLIAIGEANFFSTQVRYDMEPMASIGQWSPIAGTILAALGSLYLLWSAGDENHIQSQHSDRPNNSRMSHYSHSSDLNVSYGRPSMTQFGSPRSSDANALGMTSSPSPNDISLIPTITHPESVYDRDPLTQNAVDNQPTAGRHRIRNWLTTAANAIGDAAHEKLDTSDYKDEKAHHYPAIPGEEMRNAALGRVTTQYNQLREENSRAASEYAASVRSVSPMVGAGTSAGGIFNGSGEGSSTTPPHSPRPDTSPSRGAPPKRRDTLEVPGASVGMGRRRSGSGSHSSQT